MGIIFLAFLNLIAGAYIFYAVGLYVYSILCLFNVQEIFKEPSIAWRVQTVLSVFYEPFMSIIRKRLNFKTDVSGFALILIIHFFDNILIMSGFVSMIKSLG